MNKVLRKRLPRFFKRNIGSYLGMALFIVLIVCFCTAYIVSNQSCLTSYDNMVEESNLEDGNFTLAMESETEDLIDTLGDDIDIQAQPYIDLEMNSNTEIRVFYNRENINKAVILEGDLPSASSQIALDKIFAETQNINIGDTITLEDENLTVCGIIALPDYVVSLKNVGDLLADREVFGVGLVDDEFFDNLDTTLMNYQYSYKYKKSYEQDELNQKNKNLVEKLGDNYYITDYCPIADNTRTNGVTSKIATNVQTATYFIVLGMIIIAFLFSIVSMHTFEEECSFVGVLIATGFKKSTILLHYLTIPFLLTLISSGLGLILGTTVFYEVPAKSIYDYDTLPEMIFTIDSSIFILALVIPIVVVVLINFIVFSRKINLTPLKLIRKDIKKEKKGGNANAMKRLGFISRFRIRTVMRNKGKYISLILGVFLSGWLIMFGLGMYSSFNNYIEVLPKSAVSEYQYVLKSPLPDDSIIDDDTERDSVSSYEIEYGTRMLGVSVLGICEDSKYFSDIDVSMLGKNQVIISNVMAEKVGIKKGDIINIDNKLTLHDWEAEVVDIVDFQLGVYAFTTQEILNEYIEKDEDYYNVLFSDKEIEDIDELYIASELTKEKIADSAQQMKDLMASLIVMLVAVGIICYIIVMYLLTKIVIDKNALNISLLKVFGYRNKEVNKLYLSQAEIIIIISIIVCLPLQYMLMCNMWPSMLASMSGYFYFTINAYVIAAIIILGTVTCFVTNLIHVKHVRNIDMTESLKNRE